MAYLLDTHAAIWVVTDDHRLGDSARQLLVHASPDKLIISDCTLTEFARLQTSGKLRFNGDPLDIIEMFTQRFEVQPVTPWIALRRASYDWTHRDPMDRNILATAEFRQIPLVTIDREITPFAATIGVKTIW